MSGGVDSSVAALLLSQKDYDLSGVYMRNWDTRDESGTETGCEWERDWEDVQRVCKSLDLPCELIDLSAQYWTRVFEPALKAWEDGQLTPNPDIWCNREIKFGVLMQKAVMGCGQWLATGHYANIIRNQDGRPQLMRARDLDKDQTYFLSSIPESKLRRALFPLGTLQKSDVRELAQKANLPTARREESMGLCFVGEKRRFSNFLSAQYLLPKPGDIVNMEGKVLARHQGLWRYTIGQGARISGLQERMYVASKDPVRNQILVVPRAHPALYCRSIVLHDWRWIWPDFQPPAKFQATVQVRRVMSAISCMVEEISPGNVKITFGQPEEAVAPGQVAVIWDHDWCLGCGTITATFP